MGRFLTGAVRILGRFLTGAVRILPDHAGAVQRLTLLAADPLDGAVLEQLTDGVFDDVVHDTGGRVVDPAGLLHLRFLFHDGPVAFGQADDLAQELLVHLAEDVGRQDRELVGAVRVVEPLDDVLEDPVVDAQGGGVNSSGASARPFSCWK